MAKKIFYGTYGGVLEYDGINVKSIEIDGPIENEIRTSFTRTLLEDRNKNIYAAGGGFFGKIIDSDFGGSEYISLIQGCVPSENFLDMLFNSKDC